MLQDLLVPQEPQEPLALQGLRVRLDPPEPLALPVLLEQRDRPALQGPSERQANKVFREYRASKVFKVKLDRKVRKERQVQWDPRGQPVPLVQPVLRELPDRWVLRVK